MQQKVNLDEILKPLSAVEILARHKEKMKEISPKARKTKKAPKGAFNEDNL